MGTTNFDLGQLGCILPHTDLDRAMKALTAYLKLRRIRRARVTLSCGNVEIKVPASQEGEAGFVALAVLGCLPSFRIKITKFPWWKFWIRGVKINGRACR